MVGLHRSPDRHRRRQGFGRGHWCVRAETTERARHRCDQTPDLIDANVLPDITPNNLCDSASRKNQTDDTAVTRGFSRVCPLSTGHQMSDLPTRIDFLGAANPRQSKRCLGCYPLADRGFVLGQVPVRLFARSLESLAVTLSGAPATGFLTIRDCSRPAWPDREKIPCLSFISPSSASANVRQKLVLIARRAASLRLATASG
jgi:hypothetical protein